MALRTAIVIAAAGTLALPAFADDFAPPDYRGAPRSVMVEWEFLTKPASVDIFPDTFNAVGGGGSMLFMGFQTKAELDSTGSWMWTPGDGDGGLTPSIPGQGATIAFKIQNWIDIEPEKLLRIQITSQGDLRPIVLGTTGFIGDKQVEGEFVGGKLVDDMRFFEDWIIVPNPWWELVEVAVPFGTTLDQVVIDTVSIPSPGAFALLGVAGVVGLRRRR
ncbi:MAG: hypothetical protein Tsb0013_23340 [Phycisphaerales bacterium]